MGTTGIGRTSDRQSSASATSSANTTRPLAKLRTTPPSDTAGEDRRRASPFQPAGLAKPERQRLHNDQCTRYDEARALPGGQSRRASTLTTVVRCHFPPRAVGTL